MRVQNIRLISSLIGEHINYQIIHVQNINRVIHVMTLYFSFKKKFKTAYSSSFIRNCFR
jgi:hypothetical protein